MSVSEIYLILSQFYFTNFHLHEKFESRYFFSFFKIFLNFMNNQIPFLSSSIYYCSSKVGMLFKLRLLQSYTLCPSCVHSYG